MGGCKQRLGKTKLQPDSVVEAHFQDSAPDFPLTMLLLSEAEAVAYYKESNLAEWREIEIPELSFKDMWHAFKAENTLFGRMLSQMNIQWEQVYPKFLDALSGKSDEGSAYIFDALDSAFFEYQLKRAQRFRIIEHSKSIIVDGDPCKNQGFLTALTTALPGARVIKFDAEKVAGKEQEKKRQRKEEELRKELGQLENHKVLRLALLLRELQGDSTSEYEDLLKNYEEVAESYDAVKSDWKNIDSLRDKLNSVKLNRTAFVPILDALRDDDKRIELLKLLDIEEVVPKPGEVIAEKDWKYLEITSEQAPASGTLVVSRVIKKGYKHGNSCLKKAMVVVVPLTRISLYIALLTSSLFMALLSRYIELSRWSIAGIALASAILLLSRLWAANARKGWQLGLVGGMLLLLVANRYIGLAFMPVPLTWVVARQLFARHRPSWVMVVLLPTILSILGAGISLAWVYVGRPVTVTISSIPVGGSLRIDANTVGMTPVSKRLKPGRYTITIDGVEGYEPFCTVIEVSRHGSSVFEFQLRQLVRNKVRVIADWASVRSGAGKQFSRIATVPKGTELGLLESVGSWQRVRLPDGKEGWVFEGLTEELGARADTTAMGATVVVTLTSTPSMSNVYIDDLYAGRTPLQVSLKQGIHRVTVGGVHGYESVTKNISVSDTHPNEFHFFLGKQVPERQIAQSMEASYPQPIYDGDLEKLRNDLLEALKSAGFENIVLEVDKDFSVTIKGSVQSMQEKSRLFEVVKDVRGVRHIKDLVFVVE